LLVVAVVLTYCVGYSTAVLEEVYLEVVPASYYIVPDVVKAVDLMILCMKMVAG